MMRWSNEVYQIDIPFKLRGSKMLRFEKYQGTGNDFIIFEMSELEGLQYSLLAQNVCDRRFGIGADGMIVVSSSTVASIHMIFYNADGSLATMCGNGIRCFAKYVYDHQLVETKVFTVETLAGILTIEMMDCEEEESFVRVNMGRPNYFDQSVPQLESKEPFINQVIEIDKVPYTVSSLVMGTIHTVLFVDDIDENEVAHLGYAIENHPLYPLKTNVNFCKVIDSSNLEVVTWEKGVGITLACGTGSAACTLLSQKLYDCEEKVTVHIKGGKLVMELVGDEIHMTGPATFICKGEYLYKSR